MDIKQAALLEKVKRELEIRHKNKQDSLLEYMNYMYVNELKKEYNKWPIYAKICNTLEKVANWEIKRLIINMPPRLGKTDHITKWFATWLLWKKPKTKFIVTWYSTELMERFSSEARLWYESNTYKTIFPRRSSLREDQNTKKWWTNNDSWSYYAVWSWWTITWVWADIILVDDPLNPKDESSDLVRSWINNWFHNVLESRLDDKRNGAIVVIMQRLHSDDLCWHLMNLEKEGLWEKWDKLILPAIAEEDEDFRSYWQSINEDRLPIEYLEKIKSADKIIFSCQYQQNPIAKENQEFHEEWFKYDDYPWWWRVFTAVDPAFTKKESADDSSIATWAFIADKMYILEITAGKYDVWELVEKMIYHIKKRSPEKIGIESFQAQVTINFSLKSELSKRNINCNIEEIRQSWDKESKIRRLLPLFRNWLIFHKRDMDKLEKQLKEFPRWKHDDVIDSVQMLYDMYTLQPNTINKFEIPQIKYNNYWQPIFNY